MRATTLIFLILSLLGAPSLGIDATGAEQSASEIREQNANRNQFCANFEENFRKEILNSINVGQRQFGFYQTCFDNSLKSANHPCNKRDIEIAAINRQLHLYRTKSLKFHSALFENWVDTLNEVQRNQATSCFKKANGQVSFGNHVRLLTARGSSPFQCQGMKKAWSTYLFTVEPRALQNPMSVDMSFSEIETIRNFQNSIAGRFLSESTTHNLNLTQAELKSSVHRDFRNLNQNLKDLKEKVRKMGPDELYQLFIYEGKFESTVRQLDESDQAMARECKEMNSCTVSGMSLARCMLNAKNLLYENIPFLGMFDALNDLSEIKVSQAGQLLTDADAEKIRAEKSAQFLFNLPIATALTVAAKGGQQISKTVSRRILRENHRRLSEARQRFFAVQLRSQFEFPQLEPGTNATMTAHLMTSKENLEALTHMPSVGEISKATKSANRAHKAFGVSARVTDEQVGLTISNFQRGSQFSLNQVYRLLADAKVGVDLKDMEKLRNVDLSEVTSIARANSAFRSSQSSTGSEYLNSIGETIQETFRSIDMKNLTKEWRTLIKTDESSQAYGQYLDRIKNLLRNNLKSQHPELIQRVNSETVQEVFPNLRSNQYMRERAPANNLLDLIVMALSGFS